MSVHFNPAILARFHRCGVCGSDRHNDLLCPQTPFGRRARATLKCGYCSAPTHRRQACPKLMAEEARPLDHFALDIVAADHVPLRLVATSGRRRRWDMPA